MEELNKTQLVLLTLLVSFITSISTGIITFSLLQEAPVGVTQVINRVVEKTIEQVVPVEIGRTQTVKETTVVVKEEDLVIDAINKNSKAILRIRDTVLIDGAASPLYGIGFLISTDGFVVTDKKEGINTSSLFEASFPDGTIVQMKVATVDEENGLVYFKIIKDAKTVLPGTPIGLATKDVQLGQTVISIEGETKDIVSIGRVQSFNYIGDEKNKTIATINTDILAKTKVFGGPLVNLNGEVVGMKTSKVSSGTTDSSYVSLSLLKASITKNTK